MKFTSEKKRKEALKIIDGLMRHCESDEAYRNYDQQRHEVLSARIVRNKTRTLNHRKP